MSNLTYKIWVDGVEDVFTLSRITGDPVSQRVGGDSGHPAPAYFEYGTNFCKLVSDYNFPTEILFSNGSKFKKSATGWDGTSMLATYYFIMPNGNNPIYEYKGKQYSINRPAPWKTGALEVGDGNGSVADGAGSWLYIGNGDSLETAQYIGFYTRFYEGYTHYFDGELFAYMTVDGTAENALAAMEGARAFFDGAEKQPYYGDISTTGGGNGSYTITNNPIDFSQPPSISAASSGLVSLYAPTSTQISDLANFLWSEDFFVNVTKTFNNPIDMIIGLSIFPITPATVGAQAVKIGNIASTVAMNKIEQQFVTVDCGSIDVVEYWGSALDYAPFSKISIFLPYIGTKELNIDDIMGKTIHLRYLIDLLTGSCNAELKCGDSVLYSFTGSVNSPIPITGTDWSGLTRSLISAVVGTGVAVATGGSGAAIAAGVAGAANSVINGKPNVQKTGAIAGTSGLLAQQTPYLIYELPRQSRAENYNATMGLPSNIYAKLDTLKGFTKLSKIHLEKISATAAEAAEIEKLLYEGVIL